MAPHRHANRNNSPVSGRSCRPKFRANPIHRPTIVRNDQDRASSRIHSQGTRSLLFHSQKLSVVYLGCWQHFSGCNVFLKMSQYVLSKDMRNLRCLPPGSPSIMLRNDHRRLFKQILSSRSAFTSLFCALFSSPFSLSNCRKTYRG